MLLRARRDAPIARCGVGKAVVAVGVRLLRGQHVVAVALGAHPVVAVRLQSHFGKRDSVAAEIDDAAEQLAAVVDREFAEVEFAADLAEIAIELGRRVLAVHDEQVDAQVLEGLPLEREPTIRVGLDRLRDAAIAAAATALAAAAEVEPHLGFAHRRAKAIDDAAAQQQFGAVAGRKFVRRGHLLTLRVGAERFCDCGIGVVSLRLDRDLLARAPSYDGRIARADQARGEQRAARDHEGGEQQEDKGSIAHAVGAEERHRPLRTIRAVPHSGAL